MEFELWLEFEQWVNDKNWNKENDFANIGVILPDGRKYGINVWTYQFLPIAVQADINRKQPLGGNYLIPPDLFVKELSRECIQPIVKHLLEQGNLEEVLNESVFGIHFIAPWMEVDDLPTDESSHLQQAVLAHFGHKNASRLVLTKHAITGEVLIRLPSNKLAVVSFLDWKEGNRLPKPTLYQNKKEFWEKRLRTDIKEYRK